jgi:type II secretory pathway component GspD/PulD (secretin)
MWRTVHRSRRIPLILILALVTVISAWPAAAGATIPVQVTAVGVKTFPGVIQVSVSGSGPLRFRATTMSNPHRVLIDIPGAQMAATVPAVLTVQQPPVLRVRTGQYQQNTVRVVIDLSAPTAYSVNTAAPQVLTARLAVPTTAAKPPAPAVASAAAPPVAVAPAAPAAVAQAQAPPGGPGAITIDLRNAEIADVLSALAKLCLFNIVTDPSVKGTITVRLVNVTCDEALRFILDANNLAFRRVGNNLIIMAAEKLAPPPEVPEAVLYSLGYANPDQVRAAVAAAVPGVRVAIDPRTNILIVFGTAAQQEQVQKILQGLDIQIATMIIETRVVDISTQVLRDMGLTWGSTTGLVAFPVTIESITVPGAFPGTLTIATSGNPLQFFITALVQQDKARVLSAPRVAVIDGNKATINLGQEVPIPQRDANGNVTFTFKPVGVILEITPRLNKDRFITTTIHSEVSSIRGFTTTEVPFLNTRKADTTVTVRSGDSIIIGGMISAEEREITIKVPLLGDIPIIGALFRKTRTDRTETEVIFIVTPTLVPMGQ